MGGRLEEDIAEEKRALARIIREELTRDKFLG